MKRIAAQGDVIHNDDTVMKILDRMNLSDEERKGRKGMFTSGFLSIAGNIKIALFFTGQNQKWMPWNYVEMSTTTGE